MTQKALVIGGAGYVGATIAKTLLKSGYHVMVFDDLSSGSRARLPMDNENLLFYQGSITEPASIIDAVTQFHPDVVFHMAAVHYIPQCIKNPELAIQTNIQGTLHVVDALNTLQKKPKLVFTSSASVYGAAVAAPQPISAIPQPCDVYGYSKLVGEHLVTSRYDNYVIARLFNVFGDNDPIPHLIPSIVRQLNQPVIELGNSDSERDFIHVRDAARGFIALAEQGTVQGIYNIGSGVCFSVKHVTDALLELSGSCAEFVFHVTERRKVDPKTLCADITDITRDTNWRPRFDLRSGLKTVLESSVTPSKVRYSIDDYVKAVRPQDYIAVISDFDDTILDNGYGEAGGLHEIARIEALREIGKEMGIDFLTNITPQMSASAILNAPSHVTEGALWWMLVEVGFIAEDQPYDPKHDVIVRLTEAKGRHYRKLLVDHAKEVPGAQAFFQALFDHTYEGRLAIASSGRRDDILSFLQSHQFAHLFHEKHIIARENITNLKPHPESFLKALKSMNIPASDAARVLAFEDDPKGIIAAKQAGLTTCAITTRYTQAQLMTQPIPPDYVAHSYAQFANMLGLGAVTQSANGNKNQKRVLI